VQRSAHIDLLQLVTETP